MQHAPPEVQALFGKLFRDLERDNLERERKAAEADPRRHRLSLVFSGGKMNYHYLFGGTDGRGRRVYFCWSIHRNVAGYFLGWRQVTNNKGAGKRDQWVARKTRKGVIAIAQRRAARYHAA
jgi:hypothetical protein